MSGSFKAVIPLEEEPEQALDARWSAVIPLAEPPPAPAPPRSFLGDINAVLSMLGKGAAVGAGPVVAAWPGGMDVFDPLLNFVPSDPKMRPGRIASEWIERKLTHEQWQQQVAEASANILGEKSGHWADVAKGWSAVIGQQIPILAANWGVSAGGAALGFLVGGPVGAKVGAHGAGIGAMSLLEGNMFYKSARTQGVDDDLARYWGQRYGVGAGAIEHAQNLFMRGGGKVVKGLLKKLMVNLFGHLWEGVEEASQGALETLCMNEALKAQTARDGVPRDVTSLWTRDRLQEAVVGTGVSLALGGAVRGTKAALGVKEAKASAPAQTPEQQAARVAAAAEVAKTVLEAAAAEVVKLKAKQQEEEKAAKATKEAARKAEMDKLLGAPPPAEAEIVPPAPAQAPPEAPTQAERVPEPEPFHAVASMGGTLTAAQTASRLEQFKTGLRTVADAGKSTGERRQALAEIYGEFESNLSDEYSWDRVPGLSDQEKTWLTRLLAASEELRGPTASSEMLHKALVGEQAGPRGTAPQVGLPAQAAPKALPAPTQAALPSEPALGGEQGAAQPPARSTPARLKKARIALAKARAALRAEEAAQPPEAEAPRPSAAAELAADQPPAALAALDAAEVARIAALREKGKLAAGKPLTPAGLVLKAALAGGSVEELSPAAEAALVVEALEEGKGPGSEASLRLVASVADVIRQEAVKALGVVGVSQNRAEQVTDLATAMGDAIERRMHKRLLPAKLKKPALSLKMLVRKTARGLVRRGAELDAFQLTKKLRDKGVVSGDTEVGEEGEGVLRDTIAQPGGDVAEAVIAKEAAERQPELDRELRARVLEVLQKGVKANQSEKVQRKRLLPKLRALVELRYPGRTLTDAEVEAEVMRVMRPETHGPASSFDEAFDALTPAELAELRAAKRPAEALVRKLGGEVVAPTIVQRTFTILVEKLFGINISFYRFPAQFLGPDGFYWPGFDNTRIALSAKLSTAQYLRHVAIHELGHIIADHAPWAWEEIRLMLINAGVSQAVIDDFKTDLPLGEAVAIKLSRLEEFWNGVWRVVEKREGQRGIAKLLDQLKELVRKFLHLVRTCRWENVLSAESADSLARGVGMRFAAALETIVAVKTGEPAGAAVALRQMASIFPDDAPMLALVAAKKELAAGKKAGVVGERLTELRAAAEAAKAAAEGAGWTKELRHEWYQQRRGGEGTARVRGAKPTTSPRAEALAVLTPLVESLLTDGDPVLLTEILTGAVEGGKVKSPSALLRTLLNAKDMLLAERQRGEKLVGGWAESYGELVRRARNGKGVISSVPWAFRAARFWFGVLERRTGLPFTRLFELGCGADGLRMVARLNFGKRFAKLAKTEGVELADLYDNLRFETTMVQLLEGQSVPDASPSELAFFKELQAFLKEQETEVRLARTLNWINAPSSKSAKIKGRGRQAEIDADLVTARELYSSKGLSALRDFVATKTWGTVAKNYSPREILKGTYVVGLNGRFRPIDPHLRSRADVVQGPPTAPARSIFARCESIIDGTNQSVNTVPVVRTMTTLLQVAMARANALPSSTPKEAKARTKAITSTREAGNQLTKWLERIQGIGDTHELLARFVMGLQGRFFKLYFATPTAGLYNLGQTFVNADAPQLLRWLASPWKWKSPPGAAEYFLQNVDESLVLREVFLTTHGLNLPGDVLIARLGRFIFEGSDLLGRKLVFNAKVSEVLRAFKGLDVGSADVTKAQINAALAAAGLTALEPWQRAAFLEIAGNEGLTAAAFFAAKEHVGNVHFRYRRWERSMVEMGPVGRTVTGLLAFPRSMIERFVLDASKAFNPWAGTPLNERVRAASRLLFTYVLFNLVDYLTRRLVGQDEEEKEKELPWWSPLRTARAVSWRPGGIIRAISEWTLDTFRGLGEMLEGTPGGWSRFERGLNQLSKAFVPYYRQVTNALNAILDRSEKDGVGVKPAIEKARRLIDRYAPEEEQPVVMQRELLEKIQAGVFGSNTGLERKDTLAMAALAERFASVSQQLTNTKLSAAERHSLERSRDSAYAALRNRLPHVDSDTAEDLSQRLELLILLAKGPRAIAALKRGRPWPARMRGYAITKSLQEMKKREKK